jgi:transcriptional regulator with GAF, ATPase, and Fis domain
VNIAALPEVMVAVAQNRASTEVLRAIVDGIAGCANVALARIWLLRPGDLCATCAFAPDCADRSRCLHLVASAGTTRVAGVDPQNLVGRYQRFPLGHRKVGAVARSGEPIRHADLTGDEPWIGDRAWFRAEGIRTFAAQPLAFRGEVLGVLVLFDRSALTDEGFRWLRVFADHAAVSIANARAFEEIEQLRARLQDENQYLHEEVARVLGGAELVGDGPAMRKVAHQIQLVAPTDATVLITGESGTGKEVVARAVHAHGRRAAKPLVRVNCSSVPEPLFESEFFGHVRGAFTGALKDRPGRFELADGGTLFLDEVGEIPLPLQAKLLRVLQEQEFERVGESRTRRVDVRILAATNRDLRAEVAAGRFRQDLYYRLGVFPIELPPLRERREDIAALARHFLAVSARRLGRATPHLSQVAQAQLERHDWPGNVRELQNAVERALIHSARGPVRFDDLAAPARERVRAAAPAASAAPVRTRAELRAEERRNIEAALRTSGGKVFGPDGAASLLGMKPTTLASRIKALGIERGRR